MLPLFVVVTKLDWISVSLIYITLRHQRNVVQWCALFVGSLKWQTCIIYCYCGKLGMPKNVWGQYYVLYLDFRFLEVVLERGEDGRMEKGNCASHMFLFCTAASNLSPSIFYQRNRISFGNLQILRLQADWTFMILSHHLPLIQHEYEIWKMPAQAKTLAGHSINSSPIWN